MPVKTIDEAYALISQFRQTYIEYTRLEPIRAALDCVRLRDNKASEGGIVAILGETRSGKSKLLQDYKSRFPDQPKAIRTKDGWADRREVILLTLRNPSAKNLLESLYTELTNAPPGDVSRHDLNGSIPKIAHALETRLIIFDECHEAVDRKNDRIAHEIAVVFKILSNASMFSLVLAGLPHETTRLFKSLPELQARVLETHVIKPFRWSNERDRSDFIEILLCYDESLASVFGRLSGLNEEEVAIRIMIACRGVIGLAAKLIERAAVRAAREMLDGRGDQIAMHHLAQAFETESDNEGRPNPFHVPLGVAVAEDPVPSAPVVELPAKFRRGQSEALLNKR